MAYRKIELDEIFTNADPHAIIAEQDHLPVIREYLKDRIVIERDTGKFRLCDSGRAAEGREPADIDESIASINYTYRGYGYPLAQWCRMYSTFWIGGSSRGRTTFYR